MDRCLSKFHHVNGIALHSQRVCLTPALHPRVTSRELMETDSDALFLNFIIKMT